MVWFIAICIIYFAVIIALLTVIHRGREKAIRDKTPLPEEDLLKARDRSRRFSRTGTISQDQNHNAKKNTGCLLTLASIILLAVAVGLPCLAVWLVNQFSTPADYTKITTDLFVFSYFTAIIFGFGMCLLPLSFNKISAALNSLEKNNVQKINLFKSMNNTRTALLFVFILTFPFFAFGLNYNASYNKYEILYNPFFSYNQIVTKYEEVSNVERYFHRDSSDRISSMHYIITLNGGYTIDTLFSEPTIQTYEIHGYLKAKNPTLFDNSITAEPREDIMEFLKKNYTEEAWQRVLFIFDLE